MTGMTIGVELHDIKDAEGFIRATITKSKIRLTRDEREELVAEGFVILCELAVKFQPRMAGYQRDGSFAGYASSLLWRRLHDVWHKNNATHVLRTQADGTRQWEFLDVPVSLEALITYSDSIYHERAVDPLNNARQVGDFAK